MKRIILLLIVLAAVLISCNDNTAPKDNNLVLKISPGEQTVNIGDQVTYSVVLENAKDLFGFSAEIIFSGDLVELSDEFFTVSSVWGDDVISLGKDEIDRLNVAIGLQQTTGEDGLEGDLTLFTFTLLGKAIGISELFFQNLNLIDEEGNPLEGIEDLEIVTGNITVQ